MEASVKNERAPGGTEKHRSGKPKVVYIKIEEFPQKKNVNGSTEEEAGWLFMQK